MAKSKAAALFGTGKKLRLGIWGLGRGLNFYRSCQYLDIDVVAGCDWNEHMRRNFTNANPGAFVTDDAEKFLAQDFDAVLLATFCPAHADDAIRCLAAGKHVLSEVTSFHTMAEGVRLVEAVQASGKVYNLAENYPFSAANMWIAKKWKEGIFGELEYGEFEYVHECRTLAYTYIDDTPLIPGNQFHSWRSWLNFHYYNTHSLGPLMHITGLRPTRVVALPAAVGLAGYSSRDAVSGMGCMAPSLISMSNGSVMRNLMGATTNDSHTQRIWGTLGSAETDTVSGKVKVRVGGAGKSPKVEILPKWERMGDLAQAAGHGGGDFWVLYYFARQILTGEEAPFDIYRASDCTIPGILAYRSSMENGKAYDVPDFRDAAQRDAWRMDTFDQPRLDPKNIFPPDQDKALTEQFSLTMRDLINATTEYLAYRNTSALQADMAEPAVLLEILDKHVKSLPRLREVQELARVMVGRYPQSQAARPLREMFELSDPDVTGTAAYAKQLVADRKKIQRLVEKKKLADARAAMKAAPKKAAVPAKKATAKKAPVKKAPVKKAPVKKGPGKKR